MFERANTFKGLIAPEKAEDLLLLNNFEGQRAMSHDHVQRLLDAMSDSTFRGAEIGLAKKVYNGGTSVLVNGQHQLQAIVKFGKPIYGIIETFSCNEPDDLWKLFGTFDTHRARTEQHIMKAARGLFESENLQSVPLRVLHLAGSALTFLGGGIKPNFNARSPSKLDKATLVQKYELDVHNLAKHFSTDTSKLMNQGLATAIIATYRANAVEAYDFWERVLIGDGIQKDTPIFQLRKKILEPQLSASKISTSYYRAQGIYSMCIVWWNSHRTGEKRTSVNLASMTKVPDVSK